MPPTRRGGGDGSKWRKKKTLLQDQTAAERRLRWEDQGRGEKFGGGHPYKHRTGNDQEKEWARGVLNIGGRVG